MENDLLLDNDLLNEKPEIKAKWAGFWVRVGASFIDFFAYIPLLVLNFYNMTNLKSLPIQILILFILLLYKPYMEYKYGATLGKMAVKIKVVNKNLENISLGQSFIRYIPWLIGQVLSIYTTIVLFLQPDFFSVNNFVDVSYRQNDILPNFINTISSLIAIISCVIVAFSAKKQGLHDFMANTYCIYKKQE